VTSTTSRYRVFIPTTLVVREAAQLFETADDIELVYALPEEERIYQPTTDVDSARRRILGALQEALPTVSALCVNTMRGQLHITPEMLERAHNLLVIFVPGVGTDTVDMSAATDYGVAVVNSAGCNYVSVSEHTVGLILSLARKISISDRGAHSDHVQVSLSDPVRWPGTLRGSTLGLIGLGFIGREVARICRYAFGMEVYAYDPYFNRIEAERLGVQIVSELSSLLEASDYVSLHAPLTGDTKGLVGAEQLLGMKSSAFLINTARGAVVDTDALVAALREGQIAGAGLDVTDPEPLPAGHPLFDLENVILTPHSAGIAPDVFPRAILMASNDTLLALRGQRPQNLVNPGVWPAFTARLQKRL
jgi:D-3-phosphoglycerate dehydrogenase / 2-oxoglutarate reductase